MKVLVVINSLASGGAERVVSTLTREWAKNHQVLIALFDASRMAYNHGGAVADLRAGAPSHRTLARKFPNAVLRSLRLAHLLRRERPDRIVSFMESANFPTIVAAAVTGLLDRLCVSVRIDPRMIPRLDRLLMRITYRLALRVVAPSTGVRSALQQMGSSARKLSVIPNPVAKRTVVPRDTVATSWTRTHFPRRPRCRMARAAEGF